MFAGDYPPQGWLMCEGQMLSILEHDTLFNLIGTTYGGDGQTTFALPDLRGRIPVHYGTSSSSGRSYVLGEAGGSERITLSLNQIPAHAHAPRGTSADADRRSPKNALLAKPAEAVYAVPGTPAAMSTSDTEPSGGSQPHNNVQPFLCVNFIISLFGIFPSRD
jgi:microcystin-dependent protein